jgi:hypothetical protein
MSQWSAQAEALRLTDWTTKESCLTSNIHFFGINCDSVYIRGPVTVAERSRARTVFARSEAGIMGSNPTQGMDLWCVYVFILWLWPCNELITCLKSSVVCKMITKRRNQPYAPKWELAPKMGARGRRNNIQVCIIRERWTKQYTFCNFTLWPRIDRQSSWLQF